MIRKEDNMSEPTKKKFQVAGNKKMETMLEQQERANKVMERGNEATNHSMNQKVEVKKNKNKSDGDTHIRITKETKDVLEDIRHALRKKEGISVPANDLVSEGLNLYCKKHGIDLTKYQ